MGNAMMEERYAAAMYLQGELIHEVDLMRVLNVPLHETLHSNRECGRKQHDLPRNGAGTNHVLHNGLELIRQQLVCFIHNNGVHLLQAGHSALSKVANASRGAHNDVNRVLRAKEKGKRRGVSSSKEGVRTLPTIP